MRGYVYQCPSGYAYWPVSQRCERVSRLENCASQLEHEQWAKRWDVPVENYNVSF